jgi:hypothetical protein
MSVVSTVVTVELGPDPLVDAVAPVDVLDDDASVPDSPVGASLKQPTAAQASTSLPQRMRRRS